MMTDQEDIVCRICLESCEREEVIAPCRCTGTSKWVHRECLNQWRTVREDKAFSKCTECLANYTLVHPDGADGDTVKARQCRFSMMVWHDLLIVALIIHVPILFFSLLTFWADSETGYRLAQFFHVASAHGSGHVQVAGTVLLLLFYYTCGFLFLLELVGLGYMLVQCCCADMRSPADIYQRLMYTEGALLVAPTTSLRAAHTGPRPARAALEPLAVGDQVQPPSQYKVTCSSCLAMVCAPCCCFCCTGAGDAYYDDPEQQPVQPAHEYESVASERALAADGGLGGDEEAGDAGRRGYVAPFARHRRRPLPCCVCCSTRSLGCQRCTDELCCTPGGCNGIDCLYFPLYTGNDACWCCDCCCSSTAHGSLFDCGAAGTTGCCDVGALDCAGASLGEECLMLAVVVAVVVLVTGLVVMVIMGGTLLESVLLRHVHILQKRTLVDSYQVLDLCASDLAGRGGGGGGGGGRAATEIEMGTLSPMATMSTTSGAGGGSRTAGLTSAQYRELHHYGLLPTADDEL